MKTSLLLCTVALAGCAVQIATPTSQPVRWRQALVDGGVSQQCLQLIPPQTTCREFALANRRLYVQLRDNREGMEPLAITMMEDMMAEIKKELGLLVEYPECGIRP